ncbi:7903_t:CDS:2, partial [Acaulospora morrowiae]
KPKRKRVIKAELAKIRPHPIESPWQVDFELLKDVKAWMESLRLGKYASNFDKLHWKQIIEMKHDDLERIGVNSFKVRKAMLDNFWKIKKVLAVKEDYLLPLPKPLLNITDEEESQLSKEERFKLYYAYVRVDFKLLEGMDKNQFFFYSNIIGRN